LGARTLRLSSVVTRAIKGRDSLIWTVAAGETAGPSGSLDQHPGEMF
jgi:hypothetical protein